MKRLFSIVLVESFGEVTGDAGLGRVGCWSSVQCVVAEQCFVELRVGASDECASDAGRTLFPHPVSSDISKLASEHFRLYTLDAKEHPVRAHRMSPTPVRLAGHLE